MARNHRFIDASPEQVFAVLADARSYADWVVGSRDIPDADAAFPAPGSRFRHVIGIPPLLVRDHTEVRACEPPRLLRLETRARPLGTATVTIELAPSGTGTRVTMVEDPSGWTAPLGLLPTTHLLLRLRNHESLRRLEALVASRG